MAPIECAIYIAPENYPPIASLVNLVAGIVFPDVECSCDRECEAYADEDCPGKLLGSVVAVQDAGQAVDAHPRPILLPLLLSSLAACRFGSRFSCNARDNFSAKTDS